jgi:hypothetical protein
MICSSVNLLLRMSISRRNGLYPNSGAYKGSRSSYKIDFARDADAFPTPKWPTQSLDELIAIAFNGRMIDREDHPALLRLIGAKPSMS